MKITALKLILITPLFILLSHNLAVFPHEYMHSITAWLLGFKNNPLALNYGGTSWDNLLLLANIDENVNYKLIYSLGHRFDAALISFSGSGIANGLLFILSGILLSRSAVKRRHYIYYFIFWFNLMNLGNFYDYVPIRAFATHGDIAGITMSLNISPWWIFFIIGYSVAFLIWHFFTSTLVHLFKNLKITSTITQAIIMIICVCILFGFFGGIIGILTAPNPMIYGPITYFLAITSCLSIPGMIIALWPTREWVKRRLNNVNV